MSDSPSLPPLPARDEWPRELAGEHAHTREFFDRLGALCAAPEGRDSCDACHRPGASECQRGLSPLLDEVAGFIFMHFINEERMMKSVGYSTHEPDLHAGHVEDHANLCEALFQIITDIDKAPAVSLIRRLQAVLDRLTHQHIPDFDTPFLKRLAAL
ncbi:hemerythrin domain-containing protein [Nitrogeniibacter aestuarii]|uniref:hypothetical protein n=1 Tax=Nitrogeniibacter aestuarii TaxID=2815343 RepID=UPI001D115392|nr:hypothetical protein [Nitrogeniibacter aestuarii]